MEIFRWPLQDLGTHRGERCSRLLENAGRRLPEHHHGPGCTTGLPPMPRRADWPLSADGQERNAPWPFEPMATTGAAASGCGEATRGGWVPAGNDSRPQDYSGPAVTCVRAETRTSRSSASVCHHDLLLPTPTTAARKHCVAHSPTSVKPS